jgi:hypothetical protein
VRTTILTAVILAVASMAAPRSPAKDLVEIRVHGHYFSAPATIPVTVAVEPGASNRALMVEVDGDNYYRSSGKDLEGEKEKRLHVMEFRNLPAGRYALRARVMSKNGVLGTAVEGLLVTGMIEEP